MLINLISTRADTGIYTDLWSQSFFDAIDDDQLFDAEVEAIKVAATITEPPEGNGKILIVGDLHRKSQPLIAAFAKAKECGAKTIFQVGDFGIWPGLAGWQWLEMVALLSRITGITMIFIDGNHEDFEQIERYPVNQFNWRPMRPGVFHAPRGHVFSHCGIRFGAMGGATSLDRQSRIPGASWWPGEEITSKDLYNLKANVDNTAVEVLLTHDTLTYAELPLDRQLKFPRPEVLRAENHRKLLDAAAEIAQPKVLIHGHFHLPKRQAFRAPWGRMVDVISLNKETDDGAYALIETEKNENII